MNLECSHILLATSNLDAAREFYIDTLGFPLIEEHERSFAFRAGAVRFSVMPGGQIVDSDARFGPNTTVMLRTDNLDAAIAELQARGVVFLEDVQEAPGFMSHIAFADPDNNLLFLAEYQRDPLLPA